MDSDILTVMAPVFLPVYFEQQIIFLTVMAPVYLAVEVTRVGPTWF